MTETLDRHWLKSSFNITHRVYWPVLKRFWPWLLGFAVLGLFLDEYTLQMQKVMEQYDSPPVLVVAALLLLSVLWQVLSGLLIVILACIGGRDALHQERTDIWRICQQNLKALTIESLRALGQALLWGFLLIVPGIVKYIRFSFVPYIVLFDPRYAQGQVDALETSETLMRGRTWVLGLMILTYFLSLLGFYGLTSSIQKSIVENPFGTSASQILFQLINVYFAILLFAIYESLNGKNSL